MSNSHIHLRLMTSADIPAGMGLVHAAGWNQTEADWKRFLDLNPAGCFAAESEGQVCGTVTTIVYGNHVAWIGMVLVRPDRRGQGIGALLLKKALQHLESRGAATIKLDATLQGKPLYQKLGFVPEHEIERWVLDCSGSYAEAPGVESGSIRDSRVHTKTLEGIIATDREVFGADRGALLRSVASDAPEFTTAVRAGEALAGYTLGRHGLMADHLGPWMARDRDTAQQLLEAFLRHTTRERIVVDGVVLNPFARGLLYSAGFTFSRPLTRMVRGANAHPGQPELFCAVLGPEFG